MKLAATIALALLATPAAAIEMAPPCLFDPEAARLVTSAGNFSPDMVDVYPEEVGQGFTHFAAHTPPHNGVPLGLLVLQHCPSDRELMVTVSAAKAENAYAHWLSMLQGARGYTMQEIAQRMERQGGRATIRTARFGSCACDWLEGQ